MRPCISAWWTFVGMCAWMMCVRICDCVVVDVSIRVYADESDDKG